MTAGDGVGRGGRGERGRVGAFIAAVDRRLLIVAAAVLFLGVAWAVLQAFDGSGSDGDALLTSPDPSSGGLRAGMPEDSAATDPASPVEPAPPAHFDGDESISGPGQMDGSSSLNLGGRTIIRSGSLDLLVDEVDTAYHRVQQVAMGAGGFVADSTFTGTGEQQRATLTIRVPADRFQSVVDELRDLAAEVRSVSTSAQDVTEEYTDLQSSLRNLQAVEAQYLDLLGRAQAIGDVLQVQERLNSVRAQIERVQGRMQLLEQLSDLGTLTVSLRPADTATVSDGGGLGEAARDAWEASLRSIEAVATVIVVAAVYSWWLVPLAVVLYLVARRWWRQPDPVTGPTADAPGGNR